MEIGTVFKWLNYPKPQYGRVKDRWFVYFGTTSILSLEQNVFIFTTTGKTKLYEKGGSRESHKNIIRFEVGEYGFEMPCVIDSYFFQNNWPVEEFNNYRSDHEVKGKLPNQVLSDFYYKLLNEGNIETIIIKDIRRNLNSIGIFNLKVPK
jgi:hypothetical protein